MTDMTAINGTYTIDPTHSTLGFVARHAMITKVRGSFTDFSGTAEIHSDATLIPSKLELLAAWLPKQAWFAGDAGVLTRVALVEGSTVVNSMRSPDRMKGRRSTWRGTARLPTMVGTVDRVSIGCAM